MQQAYCSTLRMEPICSSETSIFNVLYDVISRKIELLIKRFSLVNIFQRNNRTFKTFGKECLRTVRLKFCVIFYHIMLQVD
jgi:hypothetical protein